MGSVTVNDSAGPCNVEVAGQGFELLRIRTNHVPGVKMLGSILVAARAEVGSGARERISVSQRSRMWPCIESGLTTWYTISGWRS